MLVMSKIVLPYEPDYVGHREAEKRRQETKEWLQRRERELAERVALDRAGADARARQEALKSRALKRRPARHPDPGGIDPPPIEA
jgi:hypothetical protein